MTERDVQLEGTVAEVFAVPLCDDEDEPVVALASEPAQRDSSDEGVEAHGGGGFNRPE